MQPSFGVAVLKFIPRSIHHAFEVKNCSCTADSDSISGRSRSLSRELMLPVGWTGVAVGRSTISAIMVYFGSQPFDPKRLYARNSLRHQLRIWVDGGRLMPLYDIAFRCGIDEIHPTDFTDTKSWKRISGTRSAEACHAAPSPTHRSQRSD